MMFKIKNLLRKREEKEIERRYSVNPLFKLEKKEELKEAFLKLTQENIEKLKKITRRAKKMKYYEEVIKFKRAGEIKKPNHKVVGYFCNFIPEELIYASGAIPIRLCSGFYDTIHLAEDVLPKDICPLIKSSFGFELARMPYFEACDVIIVPTTCDGKKKLAEILSEYLPVWILELPNVKDKEQSKSYWLNEVKILKEKIEKLTGNEIMREKLKESIKILHKRAETFHRLYEIRKFSPPVISGRDALLVVQTSFYGDIKRWIDKTEELCEELEKSAKKSEGICSSEAPRLLLTGSPIIWPNFKLLNIIEESGAIIVIDDMCSGTQYLYESVEVDEYTMDGMLRAIAERYLLPSICPCFISSDDRIDRILQLTEEFEADGVVYNQLRLCQLYDMEANKIRKILETKGIPMLRIQTDYSQEDVEQIRTRVEAFLEMLKVKRK